MRFRRQFRFRRRMDLFTGLDHFTGLLSSGGSGHASHGSPNGRTKGATQSPTKNRAASRTTGGSHSDADWMKIRFFRQTRCFFHHVRNLLAHHHARQVPESPLGLRNIPNELGRRSARFAAGSHPGSGRLGLLSSPSSLLEAADRLAETLAELRSFFGPNTRRAIPRITRRCPG